MIDQSQVLSLLKVNGLNENSPLEAVDTVLNALKYSDIEKQEVFGMLMSQGWFKNISSTPNPDLMVAPVENVENKIPPELVTATPNVVRMPKSNHRGLMISVLIALVVVCIGGGLAYAYVEKIGPFKGDVLTEENTSYSSISIPADPNFLTNILNHVLSIKSFSSSLSFNLNSAPRDKDARPFVLKNLDSGLEQKYANDVKRLKDVANILQLLRNVTNAGREGVTIKYPKSINSMWLGDTKIVVSDPLTGSPYNYEVTDNGKNFNLMVSFETKETVGSISRYINKSTEMVKSTTINDRTVTFTKESPSVYYVPTSLPEPLLVRFGNSLKSIPPKVELSGSVNVLSEIVDNSLPNWSVSLNAGGDVGDVVYKVDVDTLKKGKGHFIKVNETHNMSSVAYLGVENGRWIDLIPDIATTTRKKSGVSSEASYLRDLITFYENSYSTQKEAMFNLLSKIFILADEEKLVIFKSNPTIEKIDGAEYKRYDVGINKDAIVPFYIKFVDEIGRQEYKKLGITIDPTTIDYLKSYGFSQVFDYIDKNATATLWLDSEGNPSIVKFQVRIVPPESSVQLKDRQINIEVKNTLQDVNKAVNIEEPDGAIMLEQAIKEYNKLMEPKLTANKDSTIKSNMTLLSREIENEYKKKNKTFKPFMLGPCSSIDGTIFGERNVPIYLSIVSGMELTEVTCVSKDINDYSQTWAVSAKLISEPSKNWCIDSAGNSKKITGKINSTVCN